MDLHQLTTDLHNLRSETKARHDENVTRAELLDAKLERNCIQTTAIYKAVVGELDGQLGLAAKVKILWDIRSGWKSWMKMTVSAILGAVLAAAALKYIH